MKIDISKHRAALFWKKVKVRSPEECWLWTASIRKRGYGAFNLPASIDAHRYSMTLHLGRDIPDGAHVCHHCDTPLCVNPKHLFLSNHSGNMKDAARKGRLKYPNVRANPVWAARLIESLHRGSDNHAAKLTEQNVIEMLKRRVAGATTDVLARDYGVDRSVTQGICKGEGWRHVYGMDGCPSLGDVLSVERNTKPGAKITPEIAKDIKRRLTSGETGRSIARRYDIHFGSVSDIKRGLTWKDI